MPEDWHGHPLRKDYAVGRIPVQFKEAPGPMTATDATTETPTETATTPGVVAVHPGPRRGAVTSPSEGAQEMAPRALAGGVEVLREMGSVLRLSETEASELPADGETTIMNMGPQHPSTHGVLRLMLELDGETVLRTKPVVGYLHTGMEKTGETLTYLQGGTNVTRMDYASPIFNELVFCLAVEQLHRAWSFRPGPPGSAW